MSKNKSSRVGIGNIIALAGLALLGFFTFMGALMLTSGSMGASIGIALGSVVVLSLILEAATQSKKIDNNFARWKKIEIGAIVLFLVAAVFPARYVMHFVDVLTSKDELQKVAVSDVDRLRGMFSEYEKAEQSALAITTTGLHAAIDSEKDLNVTAYFDDAAIKTPADIETWMLQERQLLLGNTGKTGVAPYRTYKHNVDSVLNKWSADVKGWNLMSIGLQSKVPGELAPAIATYLNELSEDGKLPVIVDNEGVYMFDKENQTVEISVPGLKFEKSISSTGDFKVLPLVIYILIIAIIFVQYLMTPRSAKTTIGNGQNISNKEGVNVL